MLTSLAITGIYVLDQDQALDFYVNKLGLEVGTDADLGFMRWLTVRVPGDPKREIMLELPGQATMDGPTAETVRELVTKGASGGWLIFHTDDIYAVHQDLKERGVELSEGPTEQSYGIDFGFRDPFGNPIRIAQVPS